MLTPTSNVKLRAADITDVGVVRDHNEDSFFVDPDLRFFVVADGMGGHAAGEVASAMAVEQVKNALTSARADLDAFVANPTDEKRRIVVAVLENSVRAAHQAVFMRGAQETDKQGMGTTLDVLLVTGAEAFIAHVGDSRTYLLREGKAVQITTDHTVAEVLVIEGKLSIEEAQSSPLRTILVNAIGVSPDVGVEMSHVRLSQGDRLLLCSDGLHDYFPADTEIVQHLADGDLGAGLQEIVDLAKSRGGHDNITGILVDVVECPPEDEIADDEAIPKEIERVDTLPVELEDDLERDDPDTPVGRPVVSSEVAEEAARVAQTTRAPKPAGPGDPDRPSRSGNGEAANAAARQTAPLQAARPGKRAKADAARTIGKGRKDGRIRNKRKDEDAELSGNEDTEPVKKA
jgi:protein phosphatase